jgi:hypothetical protein
MHFGGTDGAYWVVSPSIGNKGKNSAALRFWIEAVLNNHSAYMGWPCGTTMGNRFAEVPRGDVILIAHGSMENHGAQRRLVLCGTVAQASRARDPRIDDSALKHGHSQYVKLSPFASLDENPARCRAPLKNTLHDGNPQPPAIFELKRYDRKHRGNEALCAWLDNILGRARVPHAKAEAHQADRVKVNFVRIDGDANAESYEFTKQKQIVEAQKREQELVNQFVASLAKRRIPVERLRYSSGEGVFYCEVYVTNADT